MPIFSKRNAAIGYLTLRVLDRRRRRRSGLKLGLYVGLGLISFGILAVALRGAVKRRGAVATEEAGDEAAAADDAVSDEAQVVGEYVTTAPEPIPAA